MRSRTHLIAAAMVVGIVAVSTSTAAAQSVVQLPSFSSFSYSGSVEVPDSGSGRLGGVNRSASQFNRRGLNRSFMAPRQAGGAAVNATIIDLNAMDRAILGGSPQEFRKKGRRTVTHADREKEGKALVRYARRQRKAGNQTQSFEAYRMAIGLLDGRLHQLATDEFRREFGRSAEQSLQMARVARGRR